MNAAVQTHPFITQQTAVDLGAAFGPVSAAAGIYITFQWRQITLQSSDPTKNGKRQRRLTLIKQPVGDPSTQSVTYITEEMAKQLYPAEWEFFNKHGEMPISGTPLSELPGISVSQIQILMISGLRSVEDLLSINEEAVNRIGHEARFVRLVAEEWKKKADENSALTDFAEVKAAQASALQAEKHRAERAEASLQEALARLSALEKLVGGSPQMAASGMPVGPGADPVAFDSGPAVEETYNALAEGTGEMDDDPLM